MAKPVFLRTSVNREFGCGFVNVANVLRVFTERIPHDETVDLNKLNYRVMAATTANCSVTYADGTTVVEPETLMLFTGTKEACGAYHEWLETWLDVMAFPADMDAVVDSLENVVNDTQIVLRRLHNSEDTYSATLDEVYEVFTKSTDSAPAKELVAAALRHLVFYGHVMEYADDGDGLMYRLLKPFVDDTIMNEVIDNIRNAMNRRHLQGIETLSLDQIVAQIQFMTGHTPDQDLVQHGLSWLLRRGYVVNRGGPIDTKYQLLSTFTEE